MLDRQKCTGCHACAVACPVGCITMTEDAEDFLYPTVDAARCIHCGKCEKICPVMHRQSLSDTHSTAYGGYHTDAQIRQQSSSGGVATALARIVLARGGIVFGAAMDESCNVRHIGVESEAWLDQLRGSKYVQSTIGETYREAKEALDRGRMVLFTGTACQIAGLYAFLGREYAHLYTQDCICHGVPSPGVLRRYIEAEEKASGKRVCAVSFRNKSTGWKTYSVCVQYADGTEQYISYVQHPYMQAFLADLCLRPSCYACSFKGAHRAADFTLGDFWSVMRWAPDLNPDDKGTSLFFVHSNKGRQLLEEIKDDLLLKRLDFEQVTSDNFPMLQSIRCPRKREKFMRLCRTKGFEAAVHFGCKKKPFAIRALRKVARYVLKRK